MGVEKTPEVVGCGASIMKKVWEVRVLEQRRRTLQEQERLEKSALPSINKDWASRMSAKTGATKRAERKVKASETQTDENIWRSKKPLSPQMVPQGRPGVKGLSTPASKRQDKSFSRSQLLIFITQTQPSALVWGRAWRFNKSVPPAEGSTTSWGQSWTFTTHQPASDLWPNEPNLDPHSLHLWRRPDCRMVDPQKPDLSLPTEEWKESWKRSDQIQRVESVNEENVPKRGFFTSLLQNETSCSSEWVNSWWSTKPSDHQDHGPGPDEGLMIGSDGREMSSSWDNCWRLVNHHGGSTKSTIHQVNKTLSPEWDGSWRSTSRVFTHRLSSNPPQNQVLSLDDPSQLSETLFCKTISKFHMGDLQLCIKPEVVAEWTGSWRITKNDSEPCEELNKVIKAVPQNVDSAPQILEKNPKADTDLRYELLEDNVISCPKRQPTSRTLPVSLPSSEWKNSWKMIKHRMRPERRRYGPGLRDTLGTSKEDVNWKDSWKLTCPLLNQNLDSWQRGSPTLQIHETWKRRLSGSSSVEFPENGPTGERSWGGSWKLSRHQHRSEPGKDPEQISEEKPLENVLEPEKDSRSMWDWQDAWRVSETPFHHDKPSFSQWGDSWRGSIYHRTGQGTVREWTDESMEIQPLKKNVPSKTRTLFKNQMNPENKWSSSWRAGSVLNFQPRFYESEGKSAQQAGSSESGSKWGRSFRLANPTPELDQPWTESCPNPCPCSVLWSRKTKTQNQSNLKKTSAVWGNSHRFLQSAERSGEHIDPKVILTKQIQRKKRPYSSVEKKQAERSWAGSHLLSKTQPRPKKGSVRKLQPEDSKHKLHEGWKESWKFFLRPESLRNQTSLSLSLPSGWDESWKFLLPPN